MFLRRRSGAFSVNFDQISQIFFGNFIITLNKWTLAMLILNGTNNLHSPWVGFAFRVLQHGNNEELEPRRVKNYFLLGII